MWTVQQIWGSSWIFNVSQMTTYQWTCASDWAKRRANLRFGETMAKMVEVEMGKWREDEAFMIDPNGCFLNGGTMGFPTKNDHFGVFWGYHHFRKPPYNARTHILPEKHVSSWLHRLKGQLGGTQPRKVHINITQSKPIVQKGLVFS